MCVCVCVCTSKTFLCSLNDATCVFLNYQQECTVKLPLRIRCVQSISLPKGALIRQCVLFVYSDVILYSYEDMRLPLHNAFFFFFFFLHTSARFQNSTSPLCCAYSLKNNNKKTQAASFTTFRSDTLNPAWDFPCIRHKLASTQRTEMIVRSSDKCTHLHIV